MKTTIKLLMLTATLVVVCAGCGKSMDDPQETAASISSDEEIEPVPADTFTVGQALVSQEPFDEEGILLSFVEGKISAELDYDNIDDLYYVCMNYEEFDGTYGKYPMWNGAEWLNIDRITAMVKNTADLDTKNAEMAYSIQTTMDGKKFLLVRYNHLGLNYSKEDESCAYFVFSVNKEDWERTGRVNWTYACDSCMRHFARFYKGGLCCGNGSNGVGDSNFWISCVDSEGKVQNIYKVRELAEDWAVDFVGDYDNSEKYSGLTLQLMDAFDGKYSEFINDDYIEVEEPDKIKAFAESEQLTKVDDIGQNVRIIMTNSGLSGADWEPIDNWVKVDIN